MESSKIFFNKGIFSGLGLIYRVNLRSAREGLGGRGTVFFLFLILRVMLSLAAKRSKLRFIYGENLMLL